MSSRFVPFTEVERAFHSLDENSAELKNIAFAQVLEKIKNKEETPKWMINEMWICVEMGFRLGYEAGKLNDGR